VFVPNVSLDAVLDQKIDDAVYWMEVSGRTPKRVSLHAAPVCIADGLKRHLFDRVGAVVMCSATMCTGRGMRINLPSGTGILPVRAPIEPALHIRDGAYLPHWTKEGSVYAVNFRLADSLPAHVLEAWRSERNSILQNAKEQGRPLTWEEITSLDHLHSEKVERFLDAGMGACWLKMPSVAKLVADALAHFDNQRYKLVAWCIMPNHVHVVLNPIQGHDLPAILHSWKSFTALKASTQPFCARSLKYRPTPPRSTVIPDDPIP